MRSAGGEIPVLGAPAPSDVLLKECSSKKTIHIKDRAYKRARFLSFSRSALMEKVYIVGIEKCNEEGMTLQLSVRGRSVEAFFVADRNNQVLPKIKNALLNTGASGLLKND